MAQPERKRTQTMQVLPFSLENLRVVLPTPKMPAAECLVCQAIGVGGSRLVKGGTLEYDTIPAAVHHLKYFMRLGEQVQTTWLNICPLCDRLYYCEESSEFLIPDSEEYERYDPIRPEAVLKLAEVSWAKATGKAEIHAHEDGTWCIIRDPEKRPPQVSAPPQAVAKAAVTDLSKCDHGGLPFVETDDPAAMLDLEQRALYDVGETVVEGEMADFTVPNYQIALGALGALYQRRGAGPNDIARLMRRLHDEPELGGDHEARLLNLLALGGEALRPLLRDALSSLQVRVVIRALYTLEKLDEPDLGVAELSHPQPQVRRAAASLWPLPSEIWLAAAIARLSVEPDPSVREQLMQAVSLTPSWWKDRFYRRLFPEDVERWTRLHEAGLAALLRCGQDPEERVRLAAAKWLAPFGPFLKEMKGVPLPECCGEAVAWVERETEAAIRAELYQHIPYRRWRRLTRLQD